MVYLMLKEYQISHLSSRDSYQTQKIIPATKAGKLANGFERGKGTIVHAVQSLAPYVERALCGSAPKVQWIAREGASVTCQKCLKKLGSRPLGLDLAFVFLVLFAQNAPAEQAVECKEGIRAFNVAHAPVQIGVWVHDNAADPVVRAPKGHKQSSKAQAASMAAIRTCIKTGALGAFVYMNNQDGPGGKVCQVTNLDSMSAVCSPNEARVVFKAVK